MAKLALGRMLLRLVVVFSCLTACSGTAYPQDFRQYSPGKTNNATIRKVYLNFSGNPKQAQRLWTLLSFELDDIGVVTVNTESAADAVISGEITEANEQGSLSLGLISSELVVTGKKEQLQSCESMSTDEHSDLFVKSAKRFLETIRGKYPNLRTVSLDPSSDMEVSESFRGDLINAFPTTGFTAAEAATAGARMHVRLSRLTVPLSEKVLRYKIEVMDKAGFLSRQNGSFVLSATLLGRPPQECPDRVRDLEWMASNSSLYGIAKQVAKQIRESNRTASTRTEVIK